MMWLWWALPAAYLAVAALAQPSIAMSRYADLDARHKTPAGKRTVSADAFWLALVWPVTLTMMRGNRAIQAALDAEQIRADARKEIEQHTREEAQREADEFDRAFNGTDGLPRHVKARNLNLDFIGAQISGEGYRGAKFSGKLERIGYGSASDAQHTIVVVGGEYKYPKPDDILTINGGTA